MSRFLLWTGALALLACGAGCGSDSEPQSPGQSTPTPESTGGSKGTDGASWSAPPAAAPAPAFSFQRADGTSAAGRAILQVRPAHSEAGLSFPAYATILLATRHDVLPRIGAELALELPQLAATQSWSAPTTAPGGGLLPDGTAVAAVVTADGAPPVLFPEGTLLVARANGTLTGAIATKSEWGTISFAGEYEVECFAPSGELAAQAGWPPGQTGGLMRDDAFASTFCAQYAYLRSN